MKSQKIRMNDVQDSVIHGASQEMENAIIMNVLNALGAARLVVLHVRRRLLEINGLV